MPVPAECGLGHDRTAYFYGAAVGRALPKAAQADEEAQAQEAQRQ